MVSIFARSIGLAGVRSCKCSAHGQRMDHRHINAGPSMNDHAHPRSPLGRALGLGSAQEEMAHWWALRVSAVALVPLSLWFVASLLALAGADRAAVIVWLRRPLAAITMLLIIIAVFYHLGLATQELIADYVHAEWVQILSLIAQRSACIAVALDGVFAVLRIAFRG
jgi:succinate dehydrogenase / fumarate reductase membrane anchor subunit